MRLLEVLRHPRLPAMVHRLLRTRLLRRAGCRLRLLRMLRPLRLLRLLRSLRLLHPRLAPAFRRWLGGSPGLRLACLRLTRRNLPFTRLAPRWGLLRTTRGACVGSSMPTGRARTA